MHIFYFMFNITFVDSHYNVEVISTIIIHFYLIYEFSMNIQYN